jgi:hypothetical protein
VIVKVVGGGWIAALSRGISRHEWTKVDNEFVTFGPTNSADVEIKFPKRA